MKKRLVSLFLVVLMLVVLSVFSTSAATAYDVWVGGVRVTSQNASNVLGNGTVSYNATSNTLTLNNADIKGRVIADDYLSAGIYAYGKDLTILFYGNNTVTDGGGNNTWSMGLGVESGNLVLKGAKDASLSIVSGYALEYSVGVSVIEDIETPGKGGKLTVESGAVSVSYKGNKLKDAHGMGALIFDMEVRNSDLFSITAPPTENGYSYGINACGAVDVLGVNTVMKVTGSEGFESHGIFAISNWTQNESGGYDLISSADLTISNGASVTATGGKAELYSAGINLDGGITCSADAKSLVATGGDTDCLDKAADPEHPSCSYGINTYGNLNFEGGTVSAQAGYAYDSCGINALTETEYDTETETYIPLNGDVKIDGANVTTVSKGGYAYSDGMYVGGDLTVSSGSLTAAGGTADATNKDVQTESNAIYAGYGVAITGGTVTLSCKDVANGRDASCGIYAFDPIVLGKDMVVRNAKTDFVAGDTQIKPKSFDVPVVIEKGSTDILLGDVNGDKEVNIKDATAIQKHLAELVVLSSQALEAADFNQDSDVNIKDATAIQKKIAGLV